ncbi:MAG: DUF2877 domain-containing protein [Gammaproteobacteria bacterium]
MNSSPVRRSIRLCGSQAAQALVPGACLTSLAVFRHSCYLQTPDQSIVCLLDDLNVPGPLHVLCRLPGNFDWTAHLQPGQQGVVSDTGILLNKLFFFYSQSTSIWQPPRLATPDPDTVQTALRCLQTYLAAGRPPAEQAAQESGLGVFILPLLRGTLAEFIPTTPVAAAATGGIQALHAWLYADARPDWVAPDWVAPDSVIRLLGLGPGLTPSGDDFLVGLWVSLHALGWHTAANRLAAQIIPLAGNYTNLISLAHLRCAAQGQAAAPLHCLLQVLYTAPAAMPEAVAALTAVGHSSGWDSLAGIVLATMAYTHNPQH